MPLLAALTGVPFLAAMLIPPLRPFRHHVLHRSVPMISPSTGQRKPSSLSGGGGAHRRSPCLRWVLATPPRSRSSSDDFFSLGGMIKVLAGLDAVGRLDVVDRTPDRPGSSRSSRRSAPGSRPRLPQHNASPAVSGCGAHATGSQDGLGKGLRPGFDSAPTAGKAVCTIGVCGRLRGSGTSSGIRKTSPG